MSLQDRIVQFVGSLCDADRWSPSALARHEEGLLERLVTHAHRTVPFYEKRLEPLFAKPFGPHLGRWEEVPVLTRREVQEHRSALISTAIPSEHGPTIDYSTSGSTGEPVVVTKTSLENIVADAVVYRTGKWWSFDFDATLAFAVRRPATGEEDVAVAHMPSWGPVFAAMGHSGRRVDIHPAVPCARHYEVLLSERPAYQRGYSGRLAELAQKWLDDRRDDTFVRGLICTGEALTQDRRHAIETAWGPHAIDSYSATDTGHIARQCELGGGLHVYTDTMRVEVVDQAHRACQPGASGRVLCTPLYGYAMPLIRYEVGDYATYSPRPCPCGRSLPTLQSVEGRERDLIRFPDGTTAWPPLGFDSALSPGRLRRFQLAYNGTYGIEFRYVAETDLSQTERDAITDTMRHRLHGDLHLRFTRMNDLGSDGAIKFRTFVRDSSVLIPKFGGFRSGFQRFRGCAGRSA